MSTSTTLAPIEPHILYPLNIAKAHLGWGNHAMRMAKRNGLVIKYVSGRGYILGKDIIDFITTNGKDEKR